MKTRNTKSIENLNRVIGVLNSALLDEETAKTAKKVRQKCTDILNDVKKHMVNTKVIAPKRVEKARNAAITTLELLKGFRKNEYTNEAKTMIELSNYILDFTDIE